MLKNVNFLFLIFLGMLIQISAKDSGLQKQKGKYLIIQLTNIVDNTLLYLYKDDKKIDSTTVNNGRGEFKINSMISEDVYLSNDNRNNFQYKLFWIEPSQIKIIGDYRNLKKAKIIGSKSNDLSDKYLAIDTSYKLLDQKLDRDEREKSKKLFKWKFSELIKKNKNSLVTLFWLSWQCKGGLLSKKEIADLYAILSEGLKKENNAKIIREFLQLSSVPGVGDHFIDFEQSTVENKKIKLSSYYGKITLLEFWGSGCYPCRKENPTLVELYNKYHPLGLEILGVSLDINKEKWIKAINDDKLPWENVSDLKGEFNVAALIYGVNSIPYNILIDSEGQIIYKNIHGNNLKMLLQKLFN